MHDGTAYMNVYSDRAGLWLIETIKTGLVLPRVILVFIDVIGEPTIPQSFQRTEKINLKPTF